MVEADSHLNLFTAYIWNIYKVFEHIDMLSIDVRSKPYTVITTQLGSDFGVLGRLWSQNDVITSRLRPTANSNYLLHTYETYTKCLAHWYAVHWCMVKALHSYNHTTWLRFWGTGSLVESKWYHYVMVEADSHLRLLPTSIWDIYKVFEHIDMLSIDVWLKPYTVTVIPTVLGSDFGVLGHLRSHNDIITSWLRLTATSNS